MFNKRSKDQHSLPELDGNVRRITICWYAPNSRDWREISFHISSSGSYRDADYQAGCEVYNALVNAGHRVEITYTYDQKML